MRWNKRHPELETRQDAMLRSMNARLGALLGALGVSDPGSDPEALGDDWMGDCAHLSEILAREMDDLEME